MKDDSSSNGPTSPVQVSDPHINKL